MLKFKEKCGSWRTQQKLRRLPITSAMESFALRVGRSCNLPLSAGTFQWKLTTNVLAAAFVVCLSRLNNELNTIRSTVNKKLGLASSLTTTSYYNPSPVHHAQYLPRSNQNDSPINDNQLSWNAHLQVNVPIPHWTFFQDRSMHGRKFLFQRNVVRHFMSYSGSKQKVPNDSLENLGRFTTQEIHRVNNPLFPDVDIPRQDGLSEVENAVKEDDRMKKLTHVDNEGRARMVNVSPKQVSHRLAVAQGKITMSPDAFQLVKVNGHKKGDVLPVAQLAGVMAAKRCDTLIPLCHNIPLDHVQVLLVLNESDFSVNIEATVECWGRTGVEMEALTAVSVAALTVYDMVKKVSQEMTIGEIRLVRKAGGQSGDYKAK